MLNFRKNINPKLLRTLIIDDEPHMRKTLSRMLKEECPQVTLAGEAASVAEGLTAIRRYHPDLVLLDIKMGDGTGFDLLKQSEPVDFRVIFITAFDQYAIQAFKFSAVDYLLKPVDPEDLQQAVSRAAEELREDALKRIKILDENLTTDDPKDRKIILKTTETIHLVRVRDISYCESDANYTRFYLMNGQKIFVSRTLHEFEEMFRGLGFFRVHKSFLVNLIYVSRYERADGGYLVMENEDRVPVASRKKEELLELFEKLSG